MYTTTIIGFVCVVAIVYILRSENQAIVRTMQEVTEENTKLFHVLIINQQIIFARIAIIDYLHERLEYDDVDELIRNMEVPEEIKKDLLKLLLENAEN